MHFTETQDELGKHYHRYMPMQGLLYPLALRRSKAACGTMFMGIKGAGYAKNTNTGLCMVIMYGPVIGRWYSASLIQRNAKDDRLRWDCAIWQKLCISMLVLIIFYPEHVK
jgi:hypothetical protein